MVSIQIRNIVIGISIEVKIFIFYVEVPQSDIQISIGTDSDLLGGSGWISG